MLFVILLRHWKKFLIKCLLQEHQIILVLTSITVNCMHILKFFLMIKYGMIQKKGIRYCLINLEFRVNFKLSTFN